MAEFAKIENGFVVNTTLVNDSDIDYAVFPESEPLGQAVLASLNIEGEWVQYSLEGEFRGSFAEIGMIYDKDLDIFMYPWEM